MDHAGSAVELLLAKNKEEADALADMVNTKNDARRDFDSTITEEAIHMIQTDEHLSQSKSTVLYKQDWHKGVIGIVASRCIEKFYRPTVILTESNDKVTGSARSVDGFDVYSAISECSDLLDQFGGHMYAAGVTMPVDNVEAFRAKFEEVVAKKITQEQLTPSIYIDIPLNLDQIDRKFFNIMSQMAPFGPQNMQPLFMADDIQATNVKLLKDQHLKFTANQKGTNVAIDAIGFGLGDYFDLVNCGLKFKMAFTIEENEFRGRNTLQLFVKDLKFDD
jgi:single-stranded-DNA-specific exonuclease